jgi:signal transduction histidine kinase
MSSASPDAPSGAGVPGGDRPGRLGAFGVRLALAYAAAFALSAVLLLGLAYAALGLVLARQDAAFLRDEQARVEAAYAEGGVAGVRRHAAALLRDDRGEEILIRLADAAGATRLLVLPDEWEPADVAALDGPAAVAEIDNPRERRTLDVRTRRLASGDAVQVGMTSDERDDTLEALPRVFGFVAVPLVLLALVGGWAMARRALRPVRQLVATLEAIVATGRVGARVPPAPGEFGDLFRLFNAMLGRIEALVARLGDTLDDVAHDLRTPLTAVRGTAELALSRDREPEAYRDALARIVEAAEVAEGTLDSVMDAAEAEAGALALDLAPVALADVVRDVADLYALLADEKGVFFDADPVPAVTVSADARRLRRALANLVDNAVKYTPPGGRVTVDVTTGASEAVVTVRDTGVGIAADELPLVWDRLYRAEGTRHERGLGLGLGLARAIARAHGGRLDAQSVPGEGSAFTLALPLHAGDARANLSDL